MSETIHFDEAAGKRMVKWYLTPDVVKQRKKVLSALNLQSGEHLLDIGSGPGLLVEDMAAVIGSNGSICGIDISAGMIALSQKRCSNLPQVKELREGDATSLPYDNDEFDAAVSMQVYEYIDDIQMCLTELYRVLKPGGRAVIVCTDSDTQIWNTANLERMHRILTTLEGHCADPRLPRKLTPELLKAGFHNIKQDVYTILNSEFNENTYSYGLVDNIIRYVSGRNGITAEEINDWADELRRKDKEGAYFFSTNRYIFSVSKPDGLIVK